ncbi:uncharacterized protein LOC107846345 [Capsicum annuum]|uniref:uncharacterized protein LOC107846345 n=1 Tax=Capsicum annuum TaxID=4072 RepID=UPI0007BFD7A5|nr:uncharacterized protein LOC107846345 [Capsicum annuum]
MLDFIMDKDSELKDIILDDRNEPVRDVKVGEIKRMVVKNTREFDDKDQKKVEKNYKTKKLLVCGIGPAGYNRNFACENIKEIWDCLKTDHEGTTDMKDSKVYILTTQYETFIMEEGETIQEMHTRFTSITNELHFLGEVISLYKQMIKILGALPKSWECNMDSITEAKNLKTFTMDELMII